MKTRFCRVLLVAASLGGLALTAGCQEDSSKNKVPVITAMPAPVGAPVEPTVSAPLVPGPVASQGQFSDANLPGETTLSLQQVQLTNAGSAQVVPVAANLTPQTNLLEAPLAEATNAVPADIQVVEPAAPPANIVTSPALQQVVNLVQSGVKEEVILSYIQNSAEPFSVGSDQLIYLNDLGVSSAVQTALIHHDATPEIRAKVQAAAAAKPLPAGVAVTTPANVYPPAPAAAPQPASPTLPAAYEEGAVVTDYAPAATVAPAAPATTVVQAQPPVTVSYFYSSLSPYGSWVNVPGYGLCWQPTIVVSNPGWRPYVDNGRWLWTDNGWYWYSDYSWGWAPFHYGRWSHRAQFGWFWVPDTSWGPAWVSWRSTADYCGWAPLPPEVHYVHGGGLIYHGSSFSVGFDFGLVDWHYTFIPTRHFVHHHPYLYYVPRHDVGLIYRRSAVINHYEFRRDHTVVNHGIGYQRVSVAARGQVPVASFRDKPWPSQTAGRVETLQSRSSGLVVERPKLPATPPPAPKLASTSRPLSATSIKTPASPGRAPQPVAAKEPLTSKLAPTTATTPKLPNTGVAAGPQPRPTTQPSTPRAPTTSAPGAKSQPAIIRQPGTPSTKPSTVTTVTPTPKSQPFRSGDPVGSTTRPSSPGSRPAVPKSPAPDRIYTSPKAGPPSASMGGLEVSRPMAGPKMNTPVPTPQPSSFSSGSSMPKSSFAPAPSTSRPSYSPSASPAPRTYSAPTPSPSPSRSAVSAPPMASPRASSSFSAPQPPRAPAASYSPPPARSQPSGPPPSSGGRSAGNYGGGKRNER